MTKDDEQSRHLIRNSTAEFLVFTSQGGGESIEVRLEDGEIWLDQALIAELFDTTQQNISLHLRTIYSDGELVEEATHKDFLLVRREGSRDVKRRIAHYNLDAIISVGYRVNSVRATQFRQWATAVLREFAIKGFVLDRKRLENGSFLGEDYFEQLLEQIREIRLSERRFYQKVADIYATAVDYNRDAPTTRTFFATVQNKLHHAVHGHTAAELIVARADADEPNMGLTTWDAAPDGKIQRSDVTVGKNYLEEAELTRLGRLVSSFLDLAEDLARRQRPMTMEDWSARLDMFLELADYDPLGSAGSVSKQQAQRHARAEFDKFRIVQDERFISDYDRFTDRVLKSGETDETNGEDA